MMGLTLGIDGGGSGCRAVLVDATGRVVRRGQAGPANIRADFAQALGNICQAAREAAGDAALETLEVGMGLAGAGDADAVRRLRDALPFARVVVATDAVASAIGALGTEFGIVAALGTGTVYLRRDADGIKQIGGRGFAIGDEAGGAWLGRRALSLALRAADGLRQATPLLADLIARHGGIPGAVAWAASARAADFALLAPEIATSTDPAALGLIEDAVQEITASISALQSDPPLQVAVIGGMAPVYVPKLPGLWPIAQARGSAVDGAVRLARMSRADRHLWRAD